jgi:hypothetical protein
MLMKLAPKKRSNPRNFYLSIGAVILIAGIGRFFALKSDQDRENHRALVTEQLAQLDATLPKQLNAVTTLEHVGLMFADTIVYRYRTDLAASSLPPERRISMEAELSRNLEQLACKAPQLLTAMRKLKIHPEHHCLARKEYLFTVKLRPEELNCPSKIT